MDALEKIVQANINPNQDNQQLKDNMEVLEKVVHAMTRKVLCLDTELKEEKKKSSTLMLLKIPNSNHRNKVKKKKKISCENIYFNDNALKVTSFTPKGMNDKVEKLDLQNIC